MGGVSPSSCTTTRWRGVRAPAAVDVLARYLHGELGASRLSAGQARAMAQASLSTMLLARLRLTAADADALGEDTVDVLLHGYA